MDFGKLDEAVKQLSVSITIEANGVEKDEWGVPISCVVLLDTHRVLDLLAGIEACCATLYYSWKEKALHMMLYRVSYGENSKARFDGELPAAVLAAVESDEFKAWVETEKARAQK